MPPTAMRWVALAIATWPALPGLGDPAAAMAGWDHSIVC